MVKDNTAIVQACLLPYHETSLTISMMNGLYRGWIPGLTSNKRTSPLQNELYWKVLFFIYHHCWDHGNALEP